MLGPPLPSAGERAAKAVTMLGARRRTTCRSWSRADATTDTSDEPELRA
ncbi:hypothetical protein QEG98_16610 [Myxococcus sp. MxC21-1]|nr:hypothetical protein [Myxococcus sp. MxC21-1]WNZ65105.1 hypothetical protein QEG98_16610 [Myxococcus sp. MxC21-1]